MIVDFLEVFSEYLIEVLPALALGFFLSGLIHEFIPDAWVERYLGREGLKPIFYSSVVGTVLPVCCIGALPIAVSFHRKGARLGPVLAFLVATPATSITALLVTYSLLGWEFTVYIFFAAIVMGLVMGIIGNRFRIAWRSGVGCVGAEPDDNLSCSSCAASAAENSGPGAGLGIRHRLRHVFRYAFWDMVRDIGPELLLGLILAALVGTLAPVGDFVGDYLAGGFGYLFSLGFGLIMYICSTASVPLADALMAEGMAPGAGMVLLLVGPVTSWGTLLVLRKQFGRRTLAGYLLTVCVLAMLLGYGFALW